MATQGHFKKYERETRTQYTEEQWGKGMLFSNNPLQEGFCKELINMDIIDMGESITPRPGLRSHELIKPQLGEIVEPPLVAETEDLNYAILAGTQTSLAEQNKTLKHIIIGDMSETAIPNTALYKGTSLRACTSESTDVLKNVTLNEEELPQHVPSDYTSQNLLNVAEVENGYTTFKTIPTTKVHDKPLETTKQNAKHVGAFAYNNDYYYFIVNDADEFCLAQSTYDKDSSKFSPKAVSFYQENPLEAVANGYNMLRDNPYTFVDEEGSGNNVTLFGALPYVDEAHTTIHTTPTKGQKMYLRCYYRCGSGTSGEFKFSIMWEWQAAGSSDWTTFKTQTDITRAVGAAVPALTAELNCPANDILIRLTVTDLITEGTPILYRLTGTYSFNKKEHGAMHNAKYVNYKLQYAQGLSYWKNRLVCYGVPEDRTLLFLSEVNQPGYFPYPNNVDIFEEPIVSVTPLLDSLLVFTTSQLYMLTLSEDGASWTKKCIQKHLNISEQDAHLICPVKNMVFFKSGNYYYMVVPKLNSMTGELVIAPISKNIEGYLDNFSENVYNTINMVYNYDKELTLVHHYNFLDFEDICNVYAFKEGEVYINFCLIYNSVGRYWRIHIYESQGLLTPLLRDATRRGEYITLSTALCALPDETVVKIPLLQTLRFDKEYVADSYIPNNVTLEDLAEVIQLTTDSTVPLERFNNYQLLDTGYREQASDHKKRYREIQFKINNLSQNTLYFYTEVCIDGDLRKEAYQYNVESVYNTASDRYELQYAKTLVNPTALIGATILGEEELPVNVWALDVSKFPDVMQWKVRIPLSGKGYTPKLVLISKNLKRFELLNNSFVYRLLNSR